ncbi:MAG: Holliday junction resolvase RuvX [Deltaproteobacteria bacterium]|nr:Holliday junction resolvase RuvX [Deltaproteobacteria bacterium]
MRILALDIGDKRTGIAVSDPMGWNQAQPVKTILTIHLLDELPKLIAEYSIEKVVIGMPYQDDGTVSGQGKKIMKKVESVKGVINIPIVFWDESLSSREAEEFLIHAGLSRKKRKSVSDTLAAVLILQSYLCEKTKNIR